MKYNRYLVIVIVIFIVFIIGELGILLYRDLTKTDKNTKDSLQSQKTKPVVSNANTPYDFNNYKTGNWFTYTNDQGVEKLMISLFVRGGIEESNQLYSVPVSILDVPFNLILGTTDSKVLVGDRTTENINFKSTLISELAKNNTLKQGDYMRVSIPLSENRNKSKIMKDDRCTEVCKNNLKLIEKQISANSTFAEMLPMSDFLKKKSISEVGPVFELIILN